MQRVAARLLDTNPPTPTTNNTQTTNIKHPANKQTPHPACAHQCLPKTTSVLVCRMTQTQVSQRSSRCRRRRRPPPVAVAAPTVEDDGENVTADYDPSYWNTQPFPHGRDNLLRELRIAKKKYPCIKLKGKNAELAQCLLDLRAGTYQPAVIDAAAAAGPKQLCMDDEMCIRLIHQILKDPHFHEQQIRLSGGDSGGPNGSLNNRNRSPSAAAAAAGGAADADDQVRVTSKSTAWQDLSRGYADPERQKYVSVAVAR